MVRPHGNTAPPVFNDIPLGLTEALAKVAASQTAMTRAILAYQRDVEMLSNCATRLIPIEQTRMAQYIQGFNLGHELTTFQESYE